MSPDGTLAISETVSERPRRGRPRSEARLVAERVAKAGLGPDGGPRTHMNHAYALNAMRSLSEMPPSWLRDPEATCAAGGRVPWTVLTEIGRLAFLEDAMGRLIDEVLARYPTRPRNLKAAATWVRRRRNALVWFCAVEAALHEREGGGA